MISDRKPGTGIQVFYDGSCPLCKTEIAFYQRFETTAQIDWVNIGDETNVTFPAGLDQNQAMARFHIQDTSGQVYSGARAFLRLWAQMPVFRYLAVMGSWAPLERLLEFIYCRFLRFRPYLSGLLKARAKH